MAATLVSLPPLPQSPLPPSPPHSPEKHDILSSATLDSGMETPTRTPLTSGSYRTTSSVESALDGEDIATPKRRTVSESSSVLRTIPMPPKRSSPVRLEDFELIRVVGKGCAGRVLLVRETQTSSVLAMKAVSKRSVLTQDELHHTLTEANILKRFAIEEPHNPFISKLHHTFTDRENFYFVMEFYPGGDLATQMEIHGPLGHHRTRFYAADIVQGLEDIHRNGIIVRDLKPENILLNAHGHAVLADFGLSRDFGYRGDPRPLYVVTYPGQGVVPEWAGKGVASLRTTGHGVKKLVVDRAYSFVGTMEYLAPEVVKRAEYSYAVDWWALGCIVLEMMIGRVPFRLLDDEPIITMYNKILHDPWDAIFQDPILKGRTPSFFGLDPVTWHFIDSLLIKDPMWRLTEPCVKDHDYFHAIDWEAVRRGEYDDPYDLQLDPVTEYNLYYFPKLCLDEEPSVDMSNHDEEYGKGDRGGKTPLTDNVTYMLEQAKYKKELDSFAWSRDEWPDYQEQLEREAVIDSARTSVETDRQESVDPESDKASEETRGVPDVPLPPLPETPLASPSVAALVPLPSPCSFDDPPSPPVGSIPLRPHLLNGLGKAGASSSPRPIPLSPSKSNIKNDKPRDMTLPTGLPASGLSVSDIMSIPSPGLNSTGRLVRRHKALPSIDTIPASRLSVDLGGTITHLDDDWEQIDSEGIESTPNGYVGGSFLNRVLKRRPSTLHSSGLRRQAKHSDVSDSSPTKFSPTKKYANPIWGGTTKKALEKIKAFPSLRKPSNPPSAYRSDLPDPPGTERTHTESGWFDKRPRLKKSVTESKLGSRSVSAKSMSEKSTERDKGVMTMSRSVSGITRDGRIQRLEMDKSSSSVMEFDPPRLELKETGPIEWDLGSK